MHNASSSVRFCDKERPTKRLFPLNCRASRVSHPGDAFYVCKNKTVPKPQWKSKSQQSTKVRQRQAGFRQKTQSAIKCRPPTEIQQTHNKTSAELITRGVKGSESHLVARSGANDLSVLELVWNWCVGMKRCTATIFSLISFWQVAWFVSSLNEQPLKWFNNGSLIIKEHLVRNFTCMFQ